MKPYYEDDSVTLYLGDALEVVSSLPDQSVDCCVTSPPYFGLRDYGVEGQYGLEASPAEYVETMRALFAEVRRVLADDGTLWLNLGDSYYSGRGASTGVDEKNPARRFGTRSLDKGGAKWAKPKNLLGMPWRTAFALQDDCWILRNDIIWAKPNGMPESVTDRLSTKHEHMFMFSKQSRYWFDLDPIREAAFRPADHEANSWARDSKESQIPGRMDKQHRVGRTWADHKADGEVRASRSPEHVGKPGTFTGGTLAGNPLGKNPGDVWTIATQPFGAAHFAVMPQALASRAIQAGCKPDGVVFDPFSGSGTTGLAAAKHGRRYVGIDLNAEYLDLSLRTRLAQSALDFGEPA